MAAIMMTHMANTSSRSIAFQSVMRGMMAMSAPASMCSMPHPMYSK
jgi:hypothetical protein